MPLSITIDAPLDQLNTMAVPAKCKALVRVSSEVEMIQALQFADDKAWPVLILGEGSNTVFIEDYPGLVILNRILGMDVVEEDDSSILLRVSAGESWHSLVETTIDNGWYGLQNLALIPGLVGAAPIQNIGAYGVELKESLISVGFIDLGKLVRKSLDCDQCQFSYRDSIFKNELAGKTAITSITLKLSKTAELNIDYPSLAQVFNSSTKPTAESVFEAICEIRQSKLPSPYQIPNSGSFFKNPIVNIQQYQAIRDEYPEIPAYQQRANTQAVIATKGDLDTHEIQNQISNDQTVKLAAAWMIEKAGWKDRVIDQVRVHQEQALVIINPSKANGKAIQNFARAVQKDIQETFGVTLEIEPQLI